MALSRLANYSKAEVYYLLGRAGDKGKPASRRATAIIRIQWIKLWLLGLSLCSPLTSILPRRRPHRGGAPGITPQLGRAGRLSGKLARWAVLMKQRAGSEEGERLLAWGGGRPLQVQMLGGHRGVLVSDVMNVPQVEAEVFSCFTLFLHPIHPPPPFLPKCPRVRPDASAKRSAAPPRLPPAEADRVRVLTLTPSALSGLILAAARLTCGCWRAGL